ncbi:hypothetical protein MTP03_21830 [Tsukamurella sp. PLM1]|nr:hypothetical protein MTP03_21830 [Tsukamurella sp. PLM1]
MSLLLVAVFAVGLRALPTSGARAPGDPYSVGGLAAHAVLPLLALTLSQVPWLVLSMRAAVHDAVGSDAVRGARARACAAVGCSGATCCRSRCSPPSPWWGRDCRR